jgi:type II secretory pathway component GspD/PulD (secretin)
MKTLPFVLITVLFTSAFPALTLTSLAAANSPSAGKTQFGTKFQNADVAVVAKAWERVFGGTVTVSDRARGRKVSLDFSATKEER